MKLLRFGVSLAAIAFFPVMAFAAPAVTVLDTAKGEVLADESGMALYTFKKDSAGVSNCYEACAEKWPPFMADGEAMAEEPYSIVERTDGTKQWAKDGLPLYYWVNDMQAGDISGDGVNDVWDLARP